MPYILILLLPSLLLCFSDQYLHEEFPLIQPVTVEFAPQSLDSDHDGILDQYDACPNTPLHIKVDKTGCKIKTLVILIQGKKQNTSIVVSTKAGSMIINEVNQYVSITSKNSPPSQPKSIEFKELESLFPLLKNKAHEQKLYYTLYFNDLDLNSESAPQLQKLLKELQSIKNPSIKIIGHTDTMGSQQDNYTLGLKRAELIAQVIKDSKVKYLNIQTDSYSELNLAIKTEDEVKEQLNRRVEIFIQ